MTVDGRMCLTLQYATPIWFDEADAFADGLPATLQLAAKLSKVGAQ